MMSAIWSFPARCLFAVLSGGIYAMAYPPLGWGWLVVPGMLGLLAALHGQHGTRARAIGFLHGMTVFGVGLSWLFEVFGWLALVLWCVLAVFTALFAEMQSRASLRGIAGWKFAVFTALNWGGLEFIRAELFPLKFPWMTPGLAIGPNPLLPWIGVYGVGFLMVLAVALVMAKSRLAWFIPAVVLITGFATPLPDSEPKADDPLAVRIGGLQMEAVSLTDLIKGTEELPPEVQYVVWPEYAVPYDIRENKRDWELVRNLCRERDLTLTFGTQSRPGNGEVWRNIALTLDADGVRGEHNKVHTVHLFDDGIPGTTALPVMTKHGKVGTPVCFDCDYEGVVRRMTAAGAEMFVVPIMDAETWTARQHDQHAELFRIRACENGRWVFVCATSGVSQLIDPNGFVHARRGTPDPGAITGVMKRETRLTFYTRHGFATPWVILALAGVGWLLLLLPAGLKTQEKRDE